MQFSISDNTVALFISGLITILALIAVGGILSFILKGMTKRFPFSRLALILSLSPFCLIGFMDRGANSSLYLYAMIVILLGITIDGIAYLLEPKQIPEAETQAEANDTESTLAETKPGMIVWGKAE